MWCLITPERQEKTERIMRALAAGTGGKVWHGAPPDDGEFCVWGQKWLGEQLVPKAHAERRPYWFVDNGYWQSARGLASGYYSLSYRGIWPIEMQRPDMDRLRVRLEPWRTRSTGYVLLALPGMAYGSMFGMDMPGWAQRIRAEISQRTSRRIVTRDKRCMRRLEADIAGAFVVVTHSSKVAVDAVMAGVPAIVAETNPAAPVCSTMLDDLENPPTPDRAKWWSSLMCQQFTIPEMRDGTAKYWMDVIKEQTDGLGSVQAQLRLEADATHDDLLQGGCAVHCESGVRAGGDCPRRCGGAREEVEGCRAG